jgi:Putative DnaT-like ssDNA binding protein
MALTLIKEDGTGRVDANSYADVADGDAYHDGHLYAAAWTGASNDDKEKALVFATRLIDSQFQFNGWKAHDEQALQWPRERCQDPDKGLPVTILLLASGSYVESNIVPKAVRDAACEMARELLVADRTASAPGEGIHSDYTAHMVAGGISDITNKTYDKSDTRPVISHVAQAMLAKYGAPIKGGAGSVRLLRA